MAGIKLSAVKKTYPGSSEPAVKGVDLDIQDGEFVVLVGPSGCGKSTLLRMIAGLETISAGEIVIGDKVVNTMEPAERDIAMVFQNYALYPHMSVRQNLSYGLKNRKMARSEIDRRIEETAAILQIGDYLERKPRALSGGQRQRVAMGRAIVRDPAAFLFDEPLSNLDAKLRLHMRGEIKHLHNRLRTTSVYVTHDQLEAMTLADRLVVLNNGLIEQVGRPLDLYQKPASTFVAGFLGAPAMNLMEAEVAEGALMLGGAALAGGLQARPGRVTAGIRPEAIRLRAEPGNFRLDYVEELGGTRIVHGHIGAQRMIAQTDLATELSDEMTAELPGAELHFFHAETGQRL
ncbi:carbohydrate ABC transporter ATP-binding protein, CUT1 family [Pseudooceanicola antarcticus]|uniref:Carbohydrate ABC transporter ATP-binding protein, CUT1 family n=1 Tax=Pseudooceanicola antarcticus TaxID=1247613 RepID=A0A285IJW8_9RHOB|nr:sn-glycerol-3-phosphate ABC transporter ATP-binding protein UgpC [Pseudooceanicola antarcticus]PJE28781.1 sn-glycerol-3-phosphate ABC transporter ATP-binding protein UgpC [Pseudooceanicola antarcticus]SNY48262.1 carbohydrate ABC transporter ATP-binding protein, CUT1 family [Pseudooceanicola antarcticus]